MTNEKGVKLQTSNNSGNAPSTDELLQTEI